MKKVCRLAWHGAVAAALACLAPSHAADKPLTIVPVPDGPPRVILSSKAAERLGIATGAVTEATVARRQMVSGLVVIAAPSARPVAGPTPSTPPTTGIEPTNRVVGGFGGFAAAPNRPSFTAPAAATPVPPAKAAGESDALWVQVSLSGGEFERLAKDRPARLLPLSSGSVPLKEIAAHPSGLAPAEDTRRSMLTMMYVPAGTDHGLRLNQRLRVELPIAGDSDAKRRVIPYGAVYYDAKGSAWVYANPSPLTFERRRVVIARVEGDLAVLDDGPPVGTPIVTTGAALLYGAEIFKK